MTPEQIHGHEVIDVVMAHPEGISMADLAQAVARRIGHNVRFFTCSAENMSLPELLSFLADRDKVQLRGDLVFPGGSKACNH